MRKIPEDLRNEMAQDPYYEKCCLAHLGGCNGRIEWHHQLIYAGRQQNHKWCILPICHFHHSKAQNSQINAILEQIMASRATPEELAEYPRRKWSK